MVKKIFRASLIGLCLPIIYILSVTTLPLIEPYFAEAAVISAGMTFMDGGKALIENTQEDFDEGDLSQIIDTEQVMLIADAVVTPTPPIEVIAPVQPKPTNAGTITEKTYTFTPSKVTLPLKSGFIKNCTSVDTDTINNTVSQKPNFKIKADGTPEVLIMHTHATESYQDAVSPWFDKEYTARSTDNLRNMISVGDKIEQQLKSAGIGVIHDKTLHDYPSYNGSYERSAVTVKRILNENPTIKVVLDVHRDAIQPSADNMISPVTTIDGKRAAQVMIISGCDNGKLNMPKYMENLKFSALLQTHMESKYPTLTRPILFDYRKYNQDLTTGSILLEMGGHANTIAEAQYSGELVGKSLVSALTELK